jgi:tetratricopeptide (TPR) repeat protein
VPESAEKPSNNKLIYLSRWWPFVVIFCMLLPASILVMNHPQPEKPSKNELLAQDDKKTVSNKSLEKTTKAESPGNYLAAVFARNQNDHPNAAYYIKNALKSDPKNNILKEQLYHALLVEGKYPDAMEIAKTLKNTPHHRSMAAPLLLSIENVKNKKYPEAIALLAAKDLKGNLNALMTPLMTAWVKVGADMVRSPIHVSDVLGKDSSLETAFIIYHLALINDLLGFEKEAADYYAKALRDPEKTPFRMVEVALNFYVRTGRAEEYNALMVSSHDKATLTLLTRNDAFKMGSKNVKRLVDSANDGVAELLYSMSSILYGVNAVEDEYIYLHLALYLKPEFPAAQYLLAGSLEQSKDLPRAISVYAAIDKKSPLYFRGQIRSAEALYSILKKEEAYRILDILEQSYPAIPESQLTKADLLRDDKRYFEAIDIYTKVINTIKNPISSDWVKYFSRGIVFERAGQWDKAEADFNQALKLEPDQPDVLNYMGYSLLTYGGNIHRAKTLIQLALEQRPDDVHIIDSMGWVLYTAGEFDQALSYMEQAVELAPNDPTVMDHLGDVYYRLGRKKEARFQWERALVFKPDEKLLSELQDKIKDGLGPFIPPRSAQTAQDDGKKVE